MARRGHHCEITASVVRSIDLKIVTIGPGWVKHRKFTTAEAASRAYAHEKSFEWGNFRAIQVDYGGPLDPRIEIWREKFYRRSLPIFKRMLEQKE